MDSNGSLIILRGGESGASSQHRPLARSPLPAANKVCIDCLFAPHNRKGSQYNSIYAFVFESILDNPREVNSICEQLFTVFPSKSFTFSYLKQTEKTFTMIQSPEIILNGLGHSSMWFSQLIVCLQRKISSETLSSCSYHNSFQCCSTKFFHSYVCVILPRGNR